MAVANYHDVNGRYPPAYLNGPDGRPWHSWRVLILPFIEHEELYKAYNFDEPWDGPNNRKLAERMPRIFSFRGSTREGNTTTNYLAVVGDETVWPGSKAVTSADVTDGLDTTIALVENLGANVHWMEPRDLSLAEMDLRVNHPAGVSSPYDDVAVVMLDDTVCRLRPTLKPDVLRALLTIRGREILTANDSSGWDLLPNGGIRSHCEPLKE